MYFSYIEIEYVTISFSPARMDLAVKLLKMTSCWYCSRELLVRNSLWVGTNKTNNSPNGTSTSLAIPYLVVEIIPSWWGQLPFLFFLPMLLGGGAVNFLSGGGYARSFLTDYCYNYLPRYCLLHIMVQPALETEWASLSIGQAGSRSCLSLTTTKFNIRGKIL